MTEKFHKHKLENLIVVPKIVTIHYLEFDRFFTYGGESHDFWELVYADKEDVIVLAENERYVLKQGEVIFHKPNEFHSLSSNRTAPPNVFIITFECKSAAMRYFENKRFKLPPDLRLYIKNIIREAASTFTMTPQNPFITGMRLNSEPVLGGQQLIRLNLETLLIMLLRHASEKRNADVVFVSSENFEDTLVNEILSALKASVYEPLNMQTLCKRLNFGKSYLYKIFKEKSGFPLMQYYMRLKIDEAKLLLRQNKYTQAEISDKLCFNTPSYFCNVFKKLTGMTPRQYLQSVVPDM